MKFFAMRQFCDMLVSLGNALCSVDIKEKFKRILSVSLLRTGSVSQSAQPFVFRESAILGAV